MSMPIHIRETQLFIAEGYLGMDIAEEPLGSNVGYYVNVFLKDAGLPPGNAWCMAGVYHCHKRACRIQRLLWTYLARTGWCKGAWLHAAESTKLSILQGPDILAGAKMPRGSIWIRYDPDGCGHTGFVVDHNPDKNLMKSLEFNAGDRVKTKEYIITNINNFKGVIY